jgi:hypothetical protein
LVSIVSHMAEKKEFATVLRGKLPQSWPWIGAILMALSACASVPEQSVAPLDKQEVVARIAQSRWDALMKGDFEAAYKLMSPSARTVVKLEDFRRKAGLVNWKVANVSKVDCSADDLCAVQMDVKYAYKLRIGKTIENDQVLAETWRYTAGAWWYVPSDAM